MSNRRTKKRTRAKALPAFENDPTPERLNQAGEQVDSFITETGRKTKRLGSILDLMLSRGIIDT